MKDVSVQRKSYLDNRRNTTREVSDLMNRNPHSTSVFHVPEQRGRRDFLPHIESVEQFLLGKCELFVLLPCPKWRRIHRNRSMQGSSVSKDSNWCNSTSPCRELLSSDNANQRCYLRSIGIRTTMKTAVGGYFSTSNNYFDLFRYACHGKMFVVSIEFNAKWECRWQLEMGISLRLTSKQYLLEQSFLRRSWLWQPVYIENILSRLPNCHETYSDHYFHSMIHLKWRRRRSSPSGFSSASNAPFSTVNFNEFLVEK